MMLKEIANQDIFNKPMIFWLGITTIFCLFSTASIAFLNKKGIHKIPFSLHQKMAVISIILAFCHGMLVLSIYFNF